MKFDFFGYKICIDEKDTNYEPIKDKELDILGCKVSVNKKEWDQVCKPVKDEICYTSCRYKDVCSRKECYTFCNVAPSDLPEELKEVDKAKDRQNIQQYIRELDFGQDIKYRKKQLEKLGVEEKFIYYYRTCFHYGYTSGLYSEDEELQMISEELKLKGYEHIICDFIHDRAIIIPLESIDKENLKNEVEQYINKFKAKENVECIMFILKVLCVVVIIGLSLYWMIK